MPKNYYSKGATIPVLFAVVSTIAVCAVCLAVYQRYVVAAAPPQSPDAQASRVHTKIDAKVDTRAMVETHQDHFREEKALRAAAFLNALARSWDARNDASKKEPSPTAVIDSDQDSLSKEEEIKARGQAEMNLLERQFENEPVDNDWATETEEIAKAAFADMADTMVLEDVTCHQTFCRARMSHYDSNTRREDIDDLLATPTLAYQMTSYTLPDDNRSTVMYFARDGQTLPVLSPYLANAPPQRDINVSHSLPNTYDDQGI